MIRTHLRPLLGISLALAAVLAEAPAPAQQYDADCKPLPPGEEQLDREIAKAWLPIGLGFAIADKVCGGKNYLNKLLSDEPDPDKITPTEVFDAVRPDVPPAISTQEHYRLENEAAERLKARAEAEKRAYLNSNPADEAVRESEERDRALRADGQVPQYGVNPAPVTQPGYVAAPGYSTLPPLNPDGFITVFQASGAQADGAALESLDQIDGEGTLLSADGLQSGQFVDGELDGEGQEITADGVWRGGTYVDGGLEGPGFEVGTDEDGTQYALNGNFVDDLPDGQVTVAYDDGNMQRQLWGDGRMLTEGPMATSEQALADAPAFNRDGAWTDDEFPRADGGSLAVEAVGGSSYVSADLGPNGARDGMVRRVFADGTVQFEEWKNGKVVQRGGRGPFESTRPPASAVQVAGALPQAPGGTAAGTGTGAKSAYSSVCMRNFQKLQDREVVLMQSYPGKQSDKTQVMAARTKLFVQCMAYDPKARDNYNESIEDERSWQSGYCIPIPRLCQDFYPEVTRVILAEFDKALNDPNYSAEYGSAGGPRGGSVAAAPAAPPPSRPPSYVGEFNVVNPVMPQSFYAQHAGRGMSPDVLKQQENSDALLNRIAGLMNSASDNHQRMKYLIASLEGLIVIYRQAADVPGGREQIQGWIQSRNDTIRACQQTSSNPGDCTAPVQ
jgi:hypothetical protein